MISSAFQLNFRRRNALVRALFPLGFLAAGAAISEAGQPGKLAEELWWNISGGTVASLTSNPRFFLPADYVGWISGVEPQRNRANQFGRRLRGLITAPATGNYVFWVSGDDSCEFWLSTDDSITHKRKIAYADSYTAFQQYNKYPSQQSVSIPLVQGQRYYLEALQVEAGGDDHLSLFWQTPSGVFQVIPASAIESYEANSGAYGSSNTIEGGGATFVFGSDNSAVNQYSGLIAGGGNRVWAPLSGPGDSNVLLGSGNTINPVPAQAGLDILGSILIGVDNSTSQTQSWAVGLGNIGQTNTVTLGTYNATVPNAALIVGTGTSAENRTNGLVVLRDGTVQIPSGALQVGSESVVTPTSIQSQMGSYLNTNGYVKNYTGEEGYGVSDEALLAIGYRADASGYDAIALGERSQAWGEYSMSFGNRSGAYDWGSTAIGSDAYAGNGDCATAIGSPCMAWGNDATAIGSNSYAPADGATAIGYGAIARQEAVAIGVWAYASGDNSTAIGSAANAFSFNEVAVGGFNQSANTGNREVWVATEQQFSIGNGTGNYARSNAITTLKNGRTALTNKYWSAAAPTAVPTNATEASNGEALSVEGHAVIKGNTTLKGNTVLEGKVILAQPQGDISMGIYQ